MKDNYYKILGIDKAASQGEIKTAYRKMAKKYHPDHNKGKPDAEEQFKKVSEAYAVLSDPEKRKNYDMFGSEKFHQKFSQEDIFSGSNINDILREFGFGGFGRGGARHGGFGFGESPFDQQDFGQRSINLDAASSMEITLEESVKGGERTFTLQKGGLSENVKVKIPAGIRDGGKLRLPGKGKEYGGRKGDLYIQVKIIPHPFLSRSGDDLIAQVDIDPSTAILGGSVEVNTLDGTKRVKVAPGTEQGQKVRVKGAGVKELKSSRHGDLYIEIRIRIPKKLTPEQKTAVENLKASGL
jgi:curved DNA-binding protein